ncbi:MAG: response regulator transcription factor [Stenomitos rutilans HA7619-LM2]|nr:response regulator transcription factor [Stenomitos rutilans HA7619-LM2]
MTLSPIRVLIADDHPIIRNGLAMIVNLKPEMTIAAEATNGLEAVELFRQHQPDVTLMDLRMPHMTGVEATSAIRQEFPDARVIILTTYDGNENVYRGLQAGAKGYILKDAPLDEIVRAIHIVHMGANYIPPVIGAKLVERLEQPQLSNREHDVLLLIAEGKNNQQVATVLRIQEGTVKFHINKIFSKLGVSDRAQATLVAIKRGIVNP